jgi:hypothetical protein
MQTTTRWSRVGIWAASAALLILTSFVPPFVRPASAHSFAQRSLTLPSSAFELGLGLGLGHRSVADRTGLGINFEIGYGLSSTLELRFRTGLRLGESARVVNADYFGRPVETETYNLGNDSVANPQLGLRFLLARGRSVELALDAHAILPLDGYFGLLVGLPIALSLGERLRLDTGIFLPVVFAEPETRVDISVPFHLWIKVNPGLFLGPMTGVYFYDGGGRSVPFGFGVGSSLSYDAEVRFWLLFPDIREDRGARNFGLGVGLYVLF